MKTEIMWRCRTCHHQESCVLEPGDGHQKKLDRISSAVDRARAHKRDFPDHVIVEPLVFEPG